MAQFAALLFILTIVAQRAFAWGPEGHEIVARIAARELTPAARTEVERLLGGNAADRMAQVSSWADWQGRTRPETKPWHYVDIEIDSAGYDAARDCGGGKCVVAQIGRAADVLRDPAASQDAKTEALRWLIHLVGDLHQPLHCADDHDRGGNGVPVRIGSYETNLHRVWDSEEVYQLGEDRRDVAQRLGAAIKPRQIGAWSRGTPAQWADESFRIARDRIYGRLHRAADGVDIVSHDQLAADAPLAATQLEKGGVRLAHILNDALGARRR